MKFFRGRIDISIYFNNIIRRVEKMESAYNYGALLRRYSEFIKNLNQLMNLGFVTIVIYDRIPLFHKRLLYHWPSRSVIIPADNWKGFNCFETKSPMVIKGRKPCEVCRNYY